MSKKLWDWGVEFHGPTDALPGPEREEGLRRRKFAGTAPGWRPWNGEYREGRFGFYFFGDESCFWGNFEALVHAMGVQ